MLLNSGNKTIHYLSISGFKAVFPCFIIYIIYSDTHCSPSPLVQLLKYPCAKKQNKNTNEVQNTYCQSQNHGFCLSKPDSLSLISISRRDPCTLCFTSLPYRLWKQSTWKPFGPILFASMRREKTLHAIIFFQISRQMYSKSAECKQQLQCSELDVNASVPWHYATHLERVGRQVCYELQICEVRCLIFHFTVLITVLIMRFIPLHVVVRWIITELID